MDSLGLAQKSVQDSDETLAWWKEETISAISEAEWINCLLSELDPEDIDADLVMDYLAMTRRINYLAVKGNYELKKRAVYEQKLSNQLISKIFN
jgi:hypothetical protein|tara:strand:- start:108 stop:389 length:282 start_codon:yes stop_codon:yes gene_type:complete